jgi:hypothetical protein
VTVNHDPSGDDLRIAFFVSAYRSSAQLTRLLHTLRRAEPTAPIVVHDSFDSPLNPSMFDALADVHVLRSEWPIVWGDMSLEASRWEVFRWVLRNLDVDWLMLLSEQDYPIAPLARLRARLASSDADAVMFGSRIDALPSDGLRIECTRRYLYRYYSLPSLGIEHRLPSLPRRIAARLRRHIYATLNRLPRVLVYQTPRALGLPTRIGIMARKTPFDADFPCWFTDCWYALSRKALEHVISYVDSHPEVIRYYTRTVIPLESATGSIVFNDPELTVANYSLHTIRFSSPTSGRPDIFDGTDLEFLTSSGGAFARKFDAANTRLLDELDKAVFEVRGRPTADHAEGTDHDGGGATDVQGYISGV